jgi:long-chain fatty acid transport protein
MLAAGAAWGNEVIFLLGNDALQLSRAASGVASPRSASWVTLNPASIVDLEKRADLNLCALHPRVTLRPRGLGGNFLDGDLHSGGLAAIPTGGLILPLSTGTLGLGMYMPLGAGLDFGHSRNILGRLLPEEYDRRMDYVHGEITLAYAYRFENGWAVGAGLSGSLTRCNADHATSYILPPAHAGEWDQAFGVGFRLGVYRRWERIAVGAAYTSPHWVQRFDLYRDVLWYPIDLPQSIQAGVAFKLAPKWELTVDVKYQDWGSMDFFGRKAAEGGLHWHDQHTIKAGIEWKATERYTFMAGFSHANTPIDEDHVFTSALAPACVEDHLTFGASITVSERTQIHLVYLHAFANTLVDTGRGDLYSVLGKGSELTTAADCLALGYTIRF